MNSRKITVVLFLALLAISLNNKTVLHAVELPTNICPTDGMTNVQVDGTTRIVTPGAISSNGTGKYALSVYNQFDLATGDKAIMIIPNGVKYYLNRCNDNPFNINGTLESRFGSQTGNIGGHLIFISPKGINIGPNATINTGSLTLSTSSSTKMKDQNGNYLQDLSGSDLDLNTVSSYNFNSLNLDSANVIEYGNIASIGSVINTSAKITNQGTIKTVAADDNSEPNIDFIAGAIVNEGTIGSSNAVNFEKTDSVNLIIADKATYTYDDTNVLSGGTYELNEAVAATDTSNKMGSVYLGKDSITQANHVTINVKSNSPASAQYGSSTPLTNTSVNIEGKIDAYSLTNDSGISSGKIDITANSQDNLNQIFINNANSALNSEGDINITTGGITWIAGHGILNANNDVNIASGDLHLGAYTGVEAGDPTITGNNININSSGYLSVGAFNTLKAHNNITINAAEAHIGSNGVTSTLIDSDAGNISITTTRDTNISGNRAIRAGNGSVSVSADNIYVSDLGNNYKSTDFGATVDAPTISANNNITMTGASSFAGNVYLKSDNGEINITNNKTGSSIVFDAVSDNDGTFIAYAPVLRAKNIRIASNQGDVQILDRTKFIADDLIDISGKTGVSIINNTAESAITDAPIYKTGGLCMYTLPTGSINISSSEGPVTMNATTKGAHVDNSNVLETAFGSNILLDSGNITLKSPSSYVKLYTNNYSGNYSTTEPRPSNINLKALNDLKIIDSKDIYLKDNISLIGKNITLDSDNSINISSDFPLPYAEGFGRTENDPMLKAFDSVNITSRGNISSIGNVYILAGADATKIGKISIAGNNIQFSHDSESTFDYSILKGKSIDLAGNNINVLERAKFIANDGPITLLADNDITLLNQQTENPAWETPLDYTGLALVAKGYNGSINLTSNSGNINISAPPAAIAGMSVNTSLISGNNIISMNSQNINDIFKSYKVVDGKIISEKNYMNTTNKIINSVTKSTSNLITQNNFNDKPITEPKNNQQLVASNDNGLFDTGSEKQISNKTDSKANVEKPADNKSDNKAGSNNSSDKNNDVAKKENIRNGQVSQLLQQNTINIKGKKFDNFYGESFMNSLVKNNSKENEYRADFNAVNESVKTGYHPAGIAGFLISVKSAEDNPGQTSSVSNSFIYRHPDTSDRLGRIENEIKGLSKEELSTSLINRQEFNNVMSVLKR